jgi:hypothetical protein
MFPPSISKISRRTKKIKNDALDMKARYSSARPNE